MPGVESGPTPQGAVNWKAPRSPEIKSPAREMVLGALQARRAKNARADISGPRQVLDMMLETRLLPDLEARIRTPNAEGDPDFRELVEQIILKLENLPARSRTQETLLQGLMQMQNGFESEEVA